MCGRYAAAKDPAALAEEFEVASVPDEVLAPDYNVAPTKQVYIVMDRAIGEDPCAPPRDLRATGANERALVIAHWGLIPAWAKEPSIASRTINARVETVAEKPSFRSAFAHRRCLVPADGYYEWYQGAPQGPGGIPAKQPFYISRIDGRSLAMAGLYEWWQEGEDRWRLTCSVITTQANADVEGVHTRMPMTIRPEVWQAWLDPAVLAQEAAGLMRPPAAGLLRVHPVATRVNAVRHNGPELIQPVPMQEDAQVPLF